MSAQDVSRQARRLLRGALKASLATLDRHSGAPYASLVGVASLADATPVIFISSLARHTRNVDGDPRASLLVAQVEAEGDGLSDGRATLMGTLLKTDCQEARRRYLARHREAGDYAGFADFSVYRLAVKEVHLVQGFGRIATMAGGNFLLPGETASAIAALEQDAVDHMNTDHADALCLYATRLCGAEAGDWRAVAIDAEGLDLGCADRLVRLDFSAPVSDAATLRAMLVQLAAKARQTNPLT